MRRGFSPDAVVNSIPRAIINLQFINALSEGTILSEIAEPDPIEPNSNFLPCNDILETVKPFFERFPAPLGQIIRYRIRESFRMEQCSIKATNMQGFIEWRKGVPLLFATRTRVLFSFRPSYDRAETGHVLEGMSSSPGTRSGERLR